MSMTDTANDSGPGRRHDRIVIRSYDPGWPELFTEQASRLTSVLGSQLVVPLEHIGSTSIPQLASKPIIDMLALIENYEAFEEGMTAAESIGWLRAPEPGDTGQRKWSLCYPTIEHRTHHLHVVERQSADWPQWLAFRDYLRAHPEAALEYANLKAALAEADDQDRARYRAAKAPYIRSILALALGTDSR